MKSTINNSKFIIYDNVFSDNEFNSIWNWGQKEEYSVVGAGGNWLKVWRLSDGSPMGSTEYRHTKAPFNSPLDLVHVRILEIASSNSDMVGDWNEIIMRNYIYPRGTKIDWHNDQGYTAAAILYTHPEWSNSWGGELKIAEVPKNYDYKQAGGQVDITWKNNFLNIWGAGQYVVPKPNRIVLTPAGVWHSINRVDADAGDNCRCSIVCFFKKV